MFVINQDYRILRIGIWRCAKAYDIIPEYQLFNYREKDIVMSDKPTTDLKTFIENVNKKDKLNGKKIDFPWMKRRGK